MNAVAAMRIGLDQAREALGIAEGASPGTWLRGADGVAFRVRGLDDAILVYTELSLREAEPDDIAQRLRERLGDLLDAHGDGRGILVFPERVRPGAKGYDELVEALGDLGEWVPLEEDGDAPEAAAPATGLESLMSQMMGGGGDMQGLMQQAQRMMADPEMQQRVMAAAAQMMASMPQGADSKDAPSGGGMPGLAGLDIGALAAQAQQMLAHDPDLVRRLQEQLGGASPDDDDDEEE